LSAVLCCQGIRQPTPFRRIKFCVRLGSGNRNFDTFAHLVKRAVNGFGNIGTFRRRPSGRRADQAISPIALPYGANHLTKNHSDAFSTVDRLCPCQHLNRWRNGFSPVTLQHRHKQ